MTDISSKGTLPQLTDILYLLTDSQELLMLKVQRMRMELGGPVRSETDHAAPTLIHATPSLRPTETLAHDDAAHVPGEIEMQVPSSPLSTVTTRVPVVTVLPHPGDIASSETTSSEARTLVSAHAEVSDLIDVTSSTPSESASRSYNFFDDLDERLADLEGPDEAS